ncbi:MAG: hypothetical protein CL846_08925 [Crocinitomicaceae bacterium]|nr:hypothetical protein [Crocinitomicaceae bacterium]
MKNLISFFIGFLLVLNGFTCYSQTYGNEWIDYNQKYLEFPIIENGIQRINYSAINDGVSVLGINLSSISTSGFQVFGREKEISIEIIDNNNNGILDPSDYIQFYADKNDGWLDPLVYDSIDFCPDEYYSLFNDTIRYFLTWNNGFNNKRILNETDVNFSNYNSIDFCWKKSFIKYTDNYALGPQQSGLSSPKYDKGEGWVGPVHGKGGNYSETLSTNNYYNSGPNAYGSASITAVNNSSSNSNGDNHNTKLYVNNVLVFDSSYYSYDLLKIPFLIPASSLNNSISVKHSIGNIGQGTDYQHVSSITCLYPHNGDFSNYNDLTFGLSYNPQTKSRFTISQISNNINAPSLYMLDDIVRKIPLTVNGNDWEIVTPPPSGDTAIYYFCDTSNYNIISSLKPINNNGVFINYQTMQLDSAFLIITHPKLMTSAKNYATYRSSDYDTLVVNIEDLYNQFASGIYKNPLAIKRFLAFTMDKWPSWPSHLFLVGKSIRLNDEFDPGSRNDSIAYKNNLVPSWGYPCSDNHFSVGLNPGKKAYCIPTGRRSVSNNSTFNSYLNKVMELESNQGLNSPYTISNKEWQKNILHFSGGSDSTEQAYMKTWLNLFKDVIEDPFFGGKVESFGKDPFSSIINPTEFQDVQQRLEEGVSLITFFGHASSGGGFSQNIDDAQNWNNAEKYPIVIGLGCSSGDCHNLDTNSYSEQIVLPSQSGAIGFISTVKAGFIPYINNYTLFLYEIISQNGYNKTIGQQMVMAIDSIEDDTQGVIWEPIFESNYNGMSLQGDPSVKLNMHLKPEIVLDNQYIWTDPPIIDLGVDSFDLNIVAFNLGKAFNDSVFVEINRIYPDGSDTIYSKMVKGILKKDTITFKIESNPQSSIGRNIFNISIDLPINLIPEIADDQNNNQAQYIINISSNSILPVWPYEFSIIGNSTDTLRASTVNPLEKMNDYFFEIDTSDQFNSPFLMRQTISSIGGVVEAFPNDWVNVSTGNTNSLIFGDSIVYYWRCCPDSSVLDWKSQSFQYINNKWGWGQAHFPQFKNNTYNNIDYNYTNRSFSFSPTLKSISCKNYVQHVVLSPQWSGSLWELNGQTADYGGYITPGIMIGIIDPNTLEYWKTPFIDNSISPPDTLNSNNCFGQFNGDPAVCGSTSLMGRSREHGYFVFNSYNTNHLDTLAYFLENTVPVGHYILAYSYIPNNYGSWMIYDNPLYAVWPTSLFTSFQNLGSSGFIDQNQPDDGFIFFCKKGDPSTAQEIRSLPISPGLAPSQLIELTTSITSSLESGTINSSAIGPAFDWSSLFWEQYPLEVNSADSNRIKLYGLSGLNTSSKTLLIDTIITTNDSVINLTGLIPQSYKYLNLELETFDDSTLTPAQLKRWQVLYSPLPELALNPKKSLSLNFDTTILQQGDSGMFSIAIENVSPFNMDSLLIHYEIINNNNTFLIDYPKQDSLKARQVLIDTIKFSTTNIEDNAEFWVTANPYINTNNQDQPEQYFFNNILQKNFSISKDETNPILDVTFDGVHILNEDIISPNPEIVISLDDENPFLLLDEDLDTSNFQLFILKPNQISWERIYFTNNQGEQILNYELADSENKFVIEYRPTFSEDGIYSLKIQGRDKSGNLSGDEEYEISFEVINASSITNFYNYPNPFSTKTHFVFTLTGSIIPDEISIQILNLSGRVVKQINSNDFTNIKIGNNLTEYFWDGKDDFGDQLANGIYLYKVIAKINGIEIDHRESSGDNSFKKGFGKMYLIK